jgi:HAD superfamily hydrolase (TIGR01509 family)
VTHALVFDFDGLIVDTESSGFTTAAEVFAAHGHELSREWWHSIIGTAEHPHWSEVLEGLLGAPLPNRAQVLAERQARHHALVAEQPVRDGLVDLLDLAAEHDVPTAVASSSSREWVAGNLDRLGILDRFSVLVTRDDVTLTKPAPDLYLLACRELDVLPALAVAFEDSPNGIAAAKAAGLACVAVPGPMTATLDLTAADLVVASLADVSWSDLAALTSSA